MSSIKRLGSIEELNVRNGKATDHPLITILDLAKSQPGPVGKIHFELYAIFLKESTCSSVKYGRHHYDYQTGTLVFIAPGQVVDIEDGNEAGLHQPSGLAVFFHPDLIRGTYLGQHIKEYTFFSYEVHEALHLSESERAIVLDCLTKIRIELARPIDKHSKKLIANTLVLFLNHCMRFYDRQFITRDHINKGIVEKFESLLDHYFVSDNLLTSGLPTVSFCAEALHLSSKYFGDLIKKETGKTALEYIQLRLLDLAKEKMLDSDKSVSEIAHELGFKYPQHFIRLFKQKVGHTPNEYRLVN